MCRPIVAPATSRPKLLPASQPGCKHTANALTLAPLQWATTVWTQAFLVLRWLMAGTDVHVSLKRDAGLVFYPPRVACAARLIRPSRRVLYGRVVS